MTKLAKTGRAIKKIFCNPWSPSIIGWIYSFKGNLFKTMSPDIKIILQLLLGLSFTACAFGVYAYYSQKVKSRSIPEEFIKLKIEKNRERFRETLIKKGAVDVCPICNKQEMDIVGLSYIPNVEMNNKDLSSPLVLIGCHNCGFISLHAINRLINIEGC